MKQLSILQQISNLYAPHMSWKCAAQHRTAAKTGRTFLWVAAILASVSTLIGQSSAQVPGVVATSTTTLATGFSAGPAVTDACGDVYVYENGGSGIVEIQAGTGKVITVAANAQGYASANVALYMDAAKKNLYFPDFANFYTTHFDQVPINNCAPGAINATFANNLGNLGNYYWGTVSDAAGDAAGNVYFTTTANVTQAIYKETVTAGTPATYADTQILTWKNSISHIVADAAGNVYFTDTVTQDLYRLSISGTTYAGTPTVFVSGGHFGTVSGLSIDPIGNLYITDSKNSLLFEVPVEQGTLNPADVFATASVGVPYKVAVDAGHNIYLSNYSPGAARVNPGFAIAPAAPLATASATLPVTYVFNAAVTPTGLQTVSGPASTGPFAIAPAATGSCAVGTAQAALSSCMVNLIYTPSAVGIQASTLIFKSASGSVVSNLSGIGLGAATTIDSGGVTPVTTTFSGPSGVAVDNLGNVFVTDATANTLTKFATGSNGVGTQVSTGTLQLSGPKAVAVDASGNIFIADSGNNRIVEIPVINGVLTNASSLVLSPAVKNPQGIGVDTAGDLLIADTGDNAVLLIPNINGTLVFSAAQTLGTGLSGPSALTFDPSGNLYVAETGNNDVLRFGLPLGASTQVKVAAGFSAPTGLATDASGALFVVDSGSGSIVRFPVVNGVLGSKTLVGVTVVSPIGVAADASGNLYVTDTANKVVAEITRVTATLQFGGVNVGSTGTASSSFNSSGNLPLTFLKSDYTVKQNPAPGFAVTADTCAGATIAPGSACSLTATYSPTAPQLNAEEDLTFSANGGNGTPVLQLIGTGARITPSTLALVLTTPAGATTLNAGQAVTFTATVGTGANTSVPGGSVKFYVNGTQVGTVAVKNNVAVLSLPNGLPAGATVTVSAVYGGDVINYAGSSAQLMEQVNALSDSIALAVGAPYNNPLSALDKIGAAAGPSIVLTATITPSSTIAPGGLVTFYAGTTTIGSASVVPATGGLFQATLTTTNLRAGTTTTTEGNSFISTFNITASYSGDSVYSPVTSTPVAISILAPPTALPACATGANPTCQLVPTGAALVITPTNPTITITSSSAAGQTSGATTLTFTSYGGWAGVVNFTCSGLPAYATCNPFPGAPVVSASTPTASIPNSTVNFVINTNVAPLVLTGSSFPWWLGGITGLVLFGLRRKLRQQGSVRFAQFSSYVGAFLLLATAAFGMTACSSSSSTAFVTPAGTSHVVVTVRAAQLDSKSTTAGAIQLQDPGVPPINITLVVK